MADRYPDSRLLVLGPGEAVIESFGHRLTPALDDKADWADRAYLVLGRIDEVTANRLADAGFVLAPATRPGLRALGLYLAGAPRDERRPLLPLPGVVPRSERRRDLPTAPDETNGREARRQAGR